MIEGCVYVRPIRHHLQERVEAHFFLFLLAYYVLFELQARLAPTAVHRRHPTHPEQTPSHPPDAPPPRTPKPAATAPQTVFPPTASPI